jgi:ABC-type nitrate/sulfonate/bicarbonate transport system substrate-binding protein
MCQDRRTLTFDGIVKQGGEPREQPHAAVLASPAGNMKRRALLVAPAILGLSAETASAADRIKVGMLKPNIVTAIYWIAVKTGAFQKSGLDVAENPFPSGQTAAGIEQLMRGSIDFYIGASGEVAHADSRYIEAGKAAPIALIEGGIAGGSFFVMREDLKGKTLDELRGQNLRIGISNPSSYHLILLRAFLRDGGMTTNDLKWRFLTVGGPEMLPAMASHQLDGFLHDALTTTLALRSGIGFVFMSSDRGDMGARAKLLPGTGVCANLAFARNNPEIAKRFAKSLRDASDTYTAAPKADMVAIMAEWSRQDHAVIEDMYERFDPRVGMTRQAVQTWWDILGSAMLARGEISPKLTMNDVFDLDYVRQDS